jgi:hypothetical protein
MLLRAVASPHWLPVVGDYVEISSAANKGWNRAARDVLAEGAR